MTFSTRSATSGKLHEKQPVFIVSGCCEPVYGSPELFTKLGLSYDKDCFKGKFSNDFQYDYWGLSYPLIGAENSFVAEDEIVINICDYEMGLRLNYAVIYKGKKYAFPSLEVCFDSKQRPMSKESYGPQFSKNYKEAVKLGEKMKEELEKIFPLYEVYTFSKDECEVDRFTVGVLLPLDKLVETERLKNFKAYKKWLEMQIANADPAYAMSK